jgi:hypothetical protein
MPSSLILKVDSTKTTLEKTIASLLKVELTTWTPMAKDINSISIPLVKFILSKTV